MSGQEFTPEELQRIAEKAYSGSFRTSNHTLIGLVREQAACRREEATSTVAMIEGLAQCSMQELSSHLRAIEAEMAEYTVAGRMTILTLIALHVQEGEQTKIQAIESWILQKLIPLYRNHEVFDAICATLPTETDSIDQRISGAAALSCVIPEESIQQISAPASRDRLLTNMWLDLAGAKLLGDVAQIIQDVTAYDSRQAVESNYPSIDSFFKVCILKDNLSEGSIQALLLLTAANGGSSEYTQEFLARIRQQATDILDRYITQNPSFYAQTLTKISRRLKAEGLFDDFHHATARYLTHQADEPLATEGPTLFWQQLIKNARLRGHWGRTMQRADLLNEQFACYAAAAYQMNSMHLLKSLLSLNPDDINILAGVLTYGGALWFTDSEWTAYAFEPNTTEPDIPPRANVIWRIPPRSVIQDPVATPIEQPSRPRHRPRTPERSKKQTRQQTPPAAEPIQPSERSSDTPDALIANIKSIDRMPIEAAKRSLQTNLQHIGAIVECVPLTMGAYPISGTSPLADIGANCVAVSAMDSIGVECDLVFAAGPEILSFFILRDEQNLVLETSSSSNLESLEMEERALDWSLVCYAVEAIAHHLIAAYHPDRTIMQTCKKLTELDQWIDPTIRPPSSVQTKDERLGRFGRIIDFRLDSASCSSGRLNIGGRLHVRRSRSIDIELTYENGILTLSTDSLAQLNELFHFRDYSNPTPLPPDIFITTLVQLCHDILTTSQWQTKKQTTARTTSHDVAASHSSETIASPEIILARPKPPADVSEVSETPAPLIKSTDEEVTLPEAASSREPTDIRTPALENLTQTIEVEADPGFPDDKDRQLLIQIFSAPIPPGKKWRAIAFGTFCPYWRSQEISEITFQTDKIVLEPFTGTKGIIQITSTGGFSVVEPANFPAIVPHEVIKNTLEAIANTVEFEIIRAQEKLAKAWQAVADLLPHVTIGRLLRVNIGPQKTPTLARYGFTQAHFFPFGTGAKADLSHPSGNFTSDIHASSELDTDIPPQLQSLFATPEAQAELATAYLDSLRRSAIAQIKTQLGQMIQLQLLNEDRINEILQTETFDPDQPTDIPPAAVELLVTARELEVKAFSFDPDSGGSTSDTIDDELPIATLDVPECIREQWETWLIMNMRSRFLGIQTTTNTIIFADGTEAQEEIKIQPLPGPRSNAVADKINDIIARMAAQTKAGMIDLDAKILHIARGNLDRYELFPIPRIMPDNTVCYTITVLPERMQIAEFFLATIYDIQSDLHPNERDQTLHHFLTNIYPYLFRWSTDTVDPTQYTDEWGAYDLLLQHVGNAATAEDLHQRAISGYVRRLQTQE